MYEQAKKGGSDITLDQIEETQNTAVDEEAERPETGFCQDENGLYIEHYMIKGFLKEAMIALKGQLKIMGRSKQPSIMGDNSIKSAVNRYIHVFPEKIYLQHDEPDGQIVERPLMADTPQGKRVALATSDYVDRGTKIECQVCVIKNPFFEMKHIKDAFSYGEFSGLGQWRSARKGAIRATFK
jgi:hypothetical protein